MWSSYKQVYSSVHTHYNLFFDFLLANQNTTNGFLVSFGWLVVRLYVFFFLNFDHGASKRSCTPHVLCLLLPKPLKMKVFRSEGYCPHVLCVSLSERTHTHTHVNCH